MSAHTRRNFITQFAAMAGVSLVAAGCGDIVGPGKALQLYVLAPAFPKPNAGATPVNWQLSVALPQAPASLDTVRVALNPTPLTMDYFANASWPDRLPLMMQGLLLEGFEKDGRAGTVARDTSGLHTDYVLETEIRDFQARYAAPDAAPEIQLRVSTTLVANSAVLAHREWSRSAQAKSNALPDIIAAFNVATAELLGDIINWAIRTAPPVAEKAAEKTDEAAEKRNLEPRLPRKRSRP